MYYIGPLLFWACAEMTCGFFILCVPCIPKLVFDWGCSHRFKKDFNISTGKPSADGHSSLKVNSKVAASYALRKKSRSSDILNTAAHASAYHQIDEEAMALDDLRPSESTEDLSKRHLRGSGVHVTKTVLVTTAHSRPGDEEFNVATKLGMPWAKLGNGHYPKSEDQR